MDEASFVSSFRLAAPYVHAHRGKVFVVLVGGEAAHEKTLRSLMSDVALLHALGVRVVLVHGTRPQIDRRIKRAGHTARFEGEVRVTDAAALELVHEAVGAARARFTSTLFTHSGVRVLGGNSVIARPIGVRDGVDFLFTGEVRRVDVAAIRGQLDADAIVLVSPLGYSPTGETFNLASHDVACEVAMALGADKLVGLVEGRGVVDGRRRSISQLTPDEADALVEKRRQHGADTRKHLAAAARAVRGGVRRAHLVSRRDDGALLRELFTREGAGTLISAEVYEDVRPATLADIGPLSALLRPLEDAGVLVRRGRERLEVELDRFLVIDRDGLVIGCAALEPFEDASVGEIYCVAIHPRYRDSGRAEGLLERMEARAAELGLERIFVLTTRTAHFFQDRGYGPSSVRQLPDERRASYDRGRRSRVLMKSL